MSAGAGEGGRRRHRRVRLLVIAGSIGALLVCCCGGTASSFFLDALEDPASTYGFGCGQGGRTVNPAGKLPRVGDLSEEQVRNAAIIIKVGQDQGVPPRGWVIAIATAKRESWLRNLPHRGADNDHDSVGLFQQRPEAGWGSQEEILKPEYAAKKFYEKLVTIAGWQSMLLTDAAQAVQRSALPDAYAEHEPIATELVNALANGAARAVGSLLDPRCVTGGEIAASGWTVPLTAAVGSGFRPANRRDHFGVDFAAAYDTPIRAAAGGVVATVLCNSSSGDCDHDGGPDVTGCGWYVDINHAAGVMTRYCHMKYRPLVSVGQRVAPGMEIGYVGSSGNSSGPHLHFEIHVGGGDGNSSAIDPVEFMRGVGAPLGAGS